MKSFTIPLYIQGTEEEVRALLPELIALGYRERPYLGRGVSAIITHYSAQDEPINTLSLTAVSYSTFKETEFHQPRLLVNASDKELVLALAAMTDEQEAQEGEIWKYIGNRGDIRLFKIENINKTLNRCNIRRLYKLGGVIPDYYFPHFQGKDWVRATKEEIINLYQPSKAKEDDFPERWCIDASKLKEEERIYLQDHVDHFKNKHSSSYSLTYSNQLHCYYPFINLTPINTGEKEPILGYTEVTFSQFKKHIENITNMDKKIIGYKPKAGVDIKSAIRAVDSTDINISEAVWKDNISRRGLAFAIDSYAKDQAFAAGVLDLLFEPVYEPEKPKVKTLKLGSNALDVAIQGDGAIKIPSFRAEGSIHEVENLITALKKTIGMTTIAGYALSFNSEDRFLRIGCSGDNNLFSLNELQLVFDTYKALQ